MAVIDEVKYGKLLRHALPAVIGNDEENERTIAELERLDARPKTLEEEKLAALLPLPGTISVTRSPPKHSGR